MNKVKGKITKFLLVHIEDFLIFCGLFLIIMATFLVNVVAGIYILGIILLLLGIYFAKYLPMKGR